MTDPAQPPTTLPVDVHFDTHIPPTPTYHTHDLAMGTWLSLGQEEARARNWAASYWCWIRCAELTKSESLRIHYLSNATFALEKWRGTTQ